MISETSKSDLSALIDQAQKQVSAAASKNNVYLVPHPNGLWHAAISDTPPSQNAALLTAEQTYPAMLYYARTDLNGSSCIECETCKNAQELSSTLDWIGLCSFTPLQLWDFSHDKPLSQNLISVLDAAARRRHMLIQNELHALTEDVPSSAASLPSARSAPEWERD